MTSQHPRLQVNTEVEKHHSEIKPLMFAVVNAVSLMMVIVAVLSIAAWYLYSKYVRHAKGRTVAIKDGRV